MDQEYQARWVRRAPPFNGLSLASPSLTVPGMRRILLAVVEDLHRVWAALPLRVLEDWHERDGSVLECAETDWSVLFAALSTDEDLRAATPVEELVSIAWHTDGSEFYLRWRIAREGAHEAASFDLSGSPTMVGVISELVQRLGVRLQRQPAAEFFDSRYGG